LKIEGLSEGIHIQKTIYEKMAMSAKGRDIKHSHSRKKDFGKLGRQFLLYLHTFFPRCVIFCGIFTDSFFTNCAENRFSAVKKGRENSTTREKVDENASPDSLPAWQF
jgi:hypothetical protein